MKLAIFGIAFVSNQSFFSFPFFVGQDTELSGTLSLVLTQCCKRIKDTVQKLASDHKDIHSSVSRVGKAIDKVWCRRKCSVIVKQSFISCHCFDNISFLNLFYAVPFIPAFNNFCRSAFTVLFLTFPIAII